MLKPREYTPPAGPKTMRVCELLELRGPMSCRQMAELLDDITRNNISIVAHHAMRSQLLTIDRSRYPYRFAVCEGWRATAALMAPQARARAPKPQKNTKASRPASAAAKPHRQAMATKAPTPQPTPMAAACTPPPITTVAHARRTQPTSVWGLAACV